MQPKPFVCGGDPIARVFDPGARNKHTTFRQETQSAKREAHPGALRFAFLGAAGLLDRDLGASGFELFLDLGGFVLGDAFLDDLGSAVDQVLGFLEAQAGDDLADRLDDVQLVGAGFGELDVEFGLLFDGGGRGGAASGGQRRRRRRRRRSAPRGP